MASDRDRLIELLARCALREGEVELASGRTSNVYLDAKTVTYHPEGARLVGRAVFELIRDDDEIGGVGGLTLGADAIVVSTVLAALEAGRSVPGFSVRKEAKKHGMQRWIEGVVPPAGTRVAIVEDVVTSGGSALRAVRAAHEAGLVVAMVIPLVDREEGAAAAISDHGLVFRPVCTLREVRDAAARLRAG